jgi:hypothetical protein
MNAKKKRADLVWKAERFRALATELPLSPVAANLLDRAMENLRDERNARRSPKSHARAKRTVT